MNTSNTFRSILYSLFAIFALLASARIALAQGSLTPLGPPGPTMRTLDQIDAKLEKRTPISSLPFNITQPGSYYLTGNLTGVSGQSGVTVSTSDVTIDLNGFALTGVAGSIHGIEANAPSNVAICNGTIRNWGGSGIFAQPTSNSQFQNLRLSNNAEFGILGGPGSAIKNCVARENGESGIYVLPGSTIAHCTAEGNGRSGFFGNNSTGNVSHCSATGNGEDGISAGTVTDCDAFDNGGSGIRATTVIGCTTRDNESTGIIANTVTSSSAHSNGNAGINASMVTNCRASSNSLDGIVSPTVIGCTAIQNNRHGIRVGAMAKDNVCTGNGANGDGAGIHFSGDGVRIEGNNCYDNDWGIQSLPGTNGFIVRNSARGNSGTATNPGASASYDFDRATNTYGPVITVNGDMSANAATSHPGANIQY